MIGISGGTYGFLRLSQLLELNKLIIAKEDLG
jgi:hypothetical protein